MQTHPGHPTHLDMTSSIDSRCSVPKIHNEMTVGGPFCVLFLMWSGTFHMAENKPCSSSGACVARRSASRLSVKEGYDWMTT